MVKKLTKFYPSLSFLLTFLISFSFDVLDLGKLFFVKFLVSCLVIISNLISIKFSKNLYLLASPFLILHWWTFYSVLYIESGAFIIEQNIYGYSNGGGVLLASIMSLFFTFFFLPEKSNFYCEAGVHHVLKDGVKKSVSLYLLTLSIFILLFGFIYNGQIPLFSSNRFAYFEDAPRIVKLVYLGGSLTSFIAGIDFFLNNKKTLIAYLFAIFLGLIILSGDKFTGIFLSVLSFIAGYVIISKENIPLKKLFLWSMLITISILAIVAIGFIYMHEIGDNSLFDVIIERALALQGHVFFGVYDRYLVSNLGELPLINFFDKSTFIQPMGIDYLMYEVSDADFASAMLDQGITFTMGFPAILFVFFKKPVVYFVTVLFGFLFRFISLSVIRNTKNLNYFLIIFYYLLFFVFFDILIMGRFWKFLEIKFFLFSSAILVYYFVRFMLKTRLR